MIKKAGDLKWVEQKLQICSILREYLEHFKLIASDDREVCAPEMNYRYSLSLDICAQLDPRECWDASLEHWREELGYTLHVDELTYSPYHSRLKYVTVASENESGSQKHCFLSGG